MKVCLVLLCISVVYADQKESSEELDLGILEKFVTLKDKKHVHNAVDILKKTQEKCPKLKTDVQDAMKKVLECIEKTDVGSNTMCTTIRQNLPKCTRPLVDMLTPCIEEKHQYVLPLAIKLVTGFIDEACNRTVEELLELVNPCVFKVDDEEENKIESCKRINEQFKDDQIPTKEELCGLKSDGNECIKKLSETCKNPLTKKVNVELSKLGDDIIAEECKA